jgi:probable phosphoglycerate mutase
MKLHFIRHGDPDYKNDCLTALGKLQAEAASKRLAECKLERIYASPLGRAIETASYTAKAQGLEIETLDFMREVNWKSANGEPIPCDGHPWNLAAQLVRENKNLMHKGWENEYPFNNCCLAQSIERVAKGLDELLIELGFERQGDFYKVTRKNSGEYAIFSHAGSSTAALIHLFNMPAPFAYAMFPVNLTSVTTVILEDRHVNALTYPKFEILNDKRHTDGLCASEIVYGL